MDDVSLTAESVHIENLGGEVMVMVYAPCGSFDFRIRGKKLRIALLDCDTPVPTEAPTDALDALSATADEDRQSEAYRDQMRELEAAEAPTEEGHPFVGKRIVPDPTQKYAWVVPVEDNQPCEVAPDCATCNERTECGPSAPADPLSQQEAPCTESSQDSPSPRSSASSDSSSSPVSSDSATHCGVSSGDDLPDEVTEAALRVLDRQMVAQDQRKAYDDARSVLREALSVEHFKRFTPSEVFDALQGVVTAADYETRAERSAILRSHIDAQERIIERDRIEFHDSFDRESARCQTLQRTIKHLDLEASNWQARFHEADGALDDAERTIGELTLSRDGWERDAQVTAKNLYDEQKARKRDNDYMVMEYDALLDKLVAAESDLKNSMEQLAETASTLATEKARAEAMSEVAEAARLVEKYIYDWSAEVHVPQPLEAHRLRTALTKLDVVEREVSSDVDALRE